MQQTLALDLKTSTLSLVSSREALTSLTLRRGGRYELRLFMTEHGSPVDLPAGFTVESSAKKSADSPNALIFSSWSGASPVECTMQAAGTVLDGLLAADGDPTNDVESVDLFFDVLVLDGSGEVVAQSQRVTLTVENSVTRGGETGPELAPLSARLIESLPAVTGLVGGEPEHLDSRATVALPLGWRVLAKDGEWLRLFQLVEHDGAELPEGAVLPVDHDASANAKAWLPCSFEGVTPEELAGALVGKADASTLSAHTGNTSNPHSVTAEQVGLGSVPNYGVASQVEAEAGAVTDKLMTPERTAQAIAALGGGGGGGARTLDIQIFSTPGLSTWTKPAGAVSCECVAIGGGGGGGSGRHATDGNHRGGGGGGGGGGIVRELIMADELGATEVVTVGAGGPGGAAISANDTNGVSGIAGSASTFAGRSATGGNAGAGGVAGTGGASGSAISNGSFVHTTAFTTGVGGSGGANGAGSSPTPVAQRGPTGGGGGGGYSSGDTGGTGAAGGSQGAVPVGVKQGGSGSNPINPIVGGNGSGTRGGGGGAGTVNGGGHGGNGGVGGGGGGGGGAPNTATSSGKGGDGGNGLVIVTTYCTL
ncbi:hypothetical protein [Verrucomicrobium sp. BvORR106]|uniref:hypothetical protein n=1 Tax=Verrucomicrobium sp. BvORR106 TaxID=1403819 RepID=UPI002241027B|nr:hypothetical protein [Verrucomicrobium sp. BvORR106]